MRGEIDVPRVTPGFCLKLVRCVLESALGWREMELYERFPEKIETVTPVATRAFYARDIQRSFREARWGVPLDEMQPGDILTHWKSAWNGDDWVGHILIIMPEGFLLENISSRYREGMGAFSSGALSLTPAGNYLASRLDHAEVFRVPESI